VAHGRRAAAEGRARIRFLHAATLGRIGDPSPASSTGQQVVSRGAAAPDA
jgi:hypothetical protein